MVFKLKTPINATWLLPHTSLRYTREENLVIDNVAPINKVSNSSLSFWTKDTPIEINANDVAIISTPTQLNECAFVSENPRLDFIRALSAISRLIGFKDSPGPHSIEPSATIGVGCFVDAGVSIGENTILEPNVSIFRNTRIGANCIIRAGATIGSSGFGFEREDDGTPITFPHLGGVVIGDNVEVGACSCIARGTLGDTLIKDSVKIDNLVHIAHNCVINNNAFIIACAEISGGVEVEKNAWIAPNSSVNQKITVGANSLVGLGAVVVKDVAPGSVVAGNPARILSSTKKD